MSYGARFVSAQIKKQKALVNFTMPPGAKFPDRNAPLEFYFAVQDTILQFWNEIEEVEICLDGNRNFYSESNEVMPCGEEEYK